MTIPHNLESMTSRQLLKLQGEISSVVARRHDEEIGKAQAVETRVREELRAVLDGIDKRLSAAIAGAFPAAKPAPKALAANGHKEAKPRRSRQAGVKVAPKFRDGENVWSGRGKRPRWLNDRLAAGSTVEQFRISA